MVLWVAITVIPNPILFCFETGFQDLIAQDGLQPAILLPVSEIIGMHPHAHLHPFVYLLLWHFLAYFISVWVYTISSPETRAVFTN